MKYSILGIYLCIHSTLSFADLTKIEVNSSKAPVFIKPLITLIASKGKKKTPEQEIINDLKILNTNLSNYPARSTKAFFMSEFFKVFLQLQKNSLIRSTFSEVSLTNLTAAQKKLKENNLIISKMSEFLLVEIFLSYQSLINQKDGKKKPSMKKINLYLGSWVGEFLKLSINDFDELVAAVSRNYIKSTVQLSKLILLQSLKSVDAAPVFTKLESVPPTTPSLPIILPESSAENPPLPEVSPTTGARERIDELIEKVEQN